MRRKLDIESLYMCSKSICILKKHENRKDVDDDKEKLPFFRTSQLMWYAKTEFSMHASSCMMMNECWISFMVRSWVRYLFDNSTYEEKFFLNTKDSQISFIIFLRNHTQLILANNDRVKISFLADLQEAVKCIPNEGVFHFDLAIFGMLLSATCSRNREVPFISMFCNYAPLKVTLLTTKPRHC